jgi:hypothetical protein
VEVQILPGANICPSIRGHKIYIFSFGTIENANSHKAVGVFLCLLVLPLLSGYLVAAENLDSNSDDIIVNNNTAYFHPFETRDQNLFNLIHGQALPTNARLNKKSQSWWSTSLVITNTLNIQNHNNESIYLDYEAYRFNLAYQYGLDENWNIKFDIPLIHQSGGIFDSSIDKWHDFFGLPRGQRPITEHNQYEVQYDLSSQSLVDLNEDNTALGDIQIAIARSVIENKKTTMSLWASVKLATGDKDKLSGNGATDFSAWAAINHQLNNNWRVNLNAGAVVLGDDTYQDIPLSDYALYGHIMLAWLATENINLKVQLQGHSSYYDKSQLDILSDTYFLTFGTAIKINNCQQLDFAISEDIKVDSSPDISLLISWRSYTSHC